MIEEVSEKKKHPKERECKDDKEAIYYVLVTPEPEKNIQRQSMRKLI